MESTASIILTISNEAEQQKPLFASRASLAAVIFTFTRSGIGRHRSQAREDVRACGFRVSAAERTLPATYGASLRWDCLSKTRARRGAKIWLAFRGGHL